MKTFTKITLVAVCIVALGLAYSFLTESDSDRDRPLVMITQIIAHPALDDVRDGIVEGLSNKGFVDGDTIDIVFKSADGDPSLTVPIAQEFVRKNPTVIVPITTPSTLGMAKTTETIPIVFAGVTDPVGVGLVNSLERPGGNITGTSDRWPFRAQVEAFLSLFPNTKSVGMIFTNGDDVSQYGVDALKGFSDELGFKLELVSISTAQDVYPAATSLFQRSDAVFIGIDALVLENLDSLLKAADEASKPLFAGDSGSVEKGAVMALSIDMKDLGFLTSELVADVINGQNPGDIPVAVVSSGSLHINKTKADEFGLDTSNLAQQGYRVVE